MPPAPDANESLVPPLEAGSFEAGPPWSGGAPQVLVNGQAPVALAVDDWFVYFANVDGAILSCPVTGCPPEGPTWLAAGASVLKLFSLVAAEGRVYFVGSSGAVDSCSARGCCLTPTEYAPSPEAGANGPLATDSENLYFVASTPIGQTVYACPLGSKCMAPRALVRDVITYYSANYVDWMAASNGALYYVEQGLYYYDYGYDLIYGVSTDAGPIEGGATDGAATGGSADADAGPPMFVCSANAEVFGSSYSGSLNSFVAAGGDVYLTAPGYVAGITRCTLSPTPCAGSDAGAPCPYLPGEAPMGLATDGRNLYWTNDGASATVETCALGEMCTSPRTVASGQDHPQYVAVNSTRVFWTTSRAIYSAWK